MRRIPIERALLGLLLLSSCSLTDKQRDEVADIASEAADLQIEESDKISEIESRMDEIESRLNM